MRYWLIIFLLSSFSAFAQTETIVIGKVQDKHNKEALPFVSLGFKGFPGGTTSDFEGRFKITSKGKVDSLIVTYVGYKRFSIKVKQGISQTILVELEEYSQEMLEAVIKPGLNPALRIIDGARNRKNVNNQDEISSYKYDSYSKVDISLTNISEEMKNSKVFKPLKSLFDTIHQMRNDEGKHILPVFVSETFSKYFYLQSLGKGKEVIEGSKYSGIGIEANSYLMDLMGGQLHHYNLNRNYITILNKDFVSPIATEAHFYYIYTLLDSMDIDGLKCYKIQVNLKRKQDLGFEGFVWITDSTFALKRVTLEVGKAANVNFVNRIKIQQEMVATKETPWITSKSRIIFDFARFQKNGSGMVAGFYNAYTNIETNIDIHKEFFDYPVVTNENATSKDSVYWEDKRTEPLSSIEKEMVNKVDSVNNLPIVKTYVDIAHTIVEGYKRIGKLDWGPYMTLLGYDKVEGLRLRAGFKTNYDFSQRFVWNTYLAYGVLDEKFKYSVGLDYIIDPRRWTLVTGRYRKDYDILGITNSPISTALSGSVFQLFNFFSTNVRINQTEEYNLRFIQTFASDWTLKFMFDRNTFTPVGDFTFAYIKNPGASTPELGSSYTTSQIGVEARWAHKEVMISRGHDRLRIESAKLPVITVSYQRGIEGLFKGDFSYDKLSFIVSHHMNTSVFGTADWYIYAGKVFGRLPYPLLDVARGNESVIANTYNYSLMNFYEFVSDQFVHTSYTQRFEGVIFNKVPYINKLKLRNYLMVKAAYGQMSAQNKSLIPSTDQNGKSLLPIHTFDKEPYVEVGYGIENILKIGTIGMVHRLNYRNLPNARLFGINIGVRLQF
ncbi:MAG: hypothetical protein CFE21_03080 [Bacteroidetes bacterium B1(2017)]|nr:MAG: hypothetical protein CFE21_03080 [Bacteroidetes bacterium B1(2017)]